MRKNKNKNRKGFYNTAIKLKMANKTIKTQQIVIDTLLGNLHKCIVLMSGKEEEVVKVPSFHLSTK